MVKELVITNPNTQATNLGEQDVAGYSQIPVSVRKLKIRLIEDVSQADFIQAARTEELCETIDGIPHHAVANGLVEGHGYPQRILQIEAPFRDTLQNLAGEYYIDNQKILSYKKVDVGQVAGLLDLPPEARNMQLVFRSDALVVKDQSDEEEIIDMIAIRVEDRPVAISASEQPFAVEHQAPAEIDQTPEDNIASLNHFIKEDPNLR